MINENKYVKSAKPHDYLPLYLSQHNKPNFHAKNIIWLKITTNYSLIKIIMIDNIVLQFSWLKSCCVSVPKEYACVITNSSAATGGFLMPVQRHFPSFYSGEYKDDIFTKSNVYLMLL